jgi:hypothetical protein
MADKTPKFDLAKLTLREIAIFIGVSLAATGYGFYEFEYSVQEKKITQIEKEQKALDVSINTFQKMLINPAQANRTKTQIKKIKNEIVDIQASIEKTKVRLTGQDLEILNNLQGEADFYGVYLKSMKTSERKFSRAGLNLKEVSLIMKIESDFSALKSFIGALKNFPAVITIESLETSRDEKILPNLESRLHIKVVVL